jgi:phosphoglycerate dehydrogenase-like enzyme
MGQIIFRVSNNKIGVRNREAAIVCLAGRRNARGLLHVLDEHALLLILALMRQLPTALCNARAGVLGAPLARTLAGRTFCL